MEGHVDVVRFEESFVEAYFDILLGLPKEELVWLGSESVKLEDIQAIQKLYEAEDEYFCRLAEQESRIVGDVNLFINSEDAAAEINLFVVKEQRGRGIAKLLLDCAIKVCRERQLGCIIAVVDAGNHGARNFFTTNGFKPSRTEPNAFGQVEYRLSVY